MSFLPSSAKEAREKGYDLYSTGKPCVNGHVTARNARDSHCVACNIVRGRERIAADPQKNRDKVKAWNERNPGRNKARSALWLEENRERNRKNCRDRYYADLGRARAEKRAGYAKFIEKNRERSREYRKSHPEVIRTLSAARRAREKGALGKLSAKEVADLVRFQGGKCAYCRQITKLTIDHIIPLSRGGRHCRENIQMVCMPCNRAKSARDPIEFAQSIGRLI